jgi:hypothetical protein
MVAATVLLAPEARYPRRMGTKYLIRGRLPGGQTVQVIVVKDRRSWLQVYPIHAMPLE